MDLRKRSYLSTDQLAQLSPADYVQHLLQLDGWLARPRLELNDEGESATLTFGGMDLTGAKLALGPWMPVRLTPEKDRLLLTPHVWITHARGGRSIKARTLTTRTAQSPTVAVVELDSGRVRRVRFDRLSPTP